MSDVKKARPKQAIESAVEGMRLENGGAHKERGGSRGSTRQISTVHNNISTPTDTFMRSTSHSPVKNGHHSEVSTPITSDQEVVGGEVTVTQEPGQPPKLSRKASQKIRARTPPLFNHEEDRTAEAQTRFETIPDCTYCNRYIGSTEHALECDCTQEKDSLGNFNALCGVDSDCINRATKMECIDDCKCASTCQNRRFQRKEYAQISVFKTDKKGYGLRAEVDLDLEDFIFEYIGEVVDEVRFRKRMHQYGEEGVKHFYFMSLNPSEYIDATKKGNLGRFCNHSCNPNCYVDKWVVGDKLRMGIFAERNIQAGEELTFNYNADRYGHDAQPCYCGEINCTGVIGGKTQTGNATKLTNTTIEALGIDDGDGWDTAVAKKPRKKKAGEDDEEYVNNVKPKSLDEHGVTKVMATLMQCKEKWITVKLLGRIQHADDEKIRNRVVKMHGYQILNSNLALWKEDANIVLQIFEILDSFPRLTRNKIADSKIEATVEEFRASDDDRVASKANYLLEEWKALETGYRIPRMKREADSTAMPKKLSHFARRESVEESKARSRSLSEEERPSGTPKGPSAPSGPRNNFPQRQPSYFAGPRPPFRPRPFNELPPGWSSALDKEGRLYFYDTTGKVQWQKPTFASAPPPPPPKPTGANKDLEDLISTITNEKAREAKEKAAAGTPSISTTQETKKAIPGSGKEKWRSLPEEKQMKLYENTIFPHVKYVMDKFKGRLGKDDLKRFAKEISKKLVSSDFKNHRVEDPTKISSKKERQVKQTVKDYFDKAAKKHKEREERRSERKAQHAAAGQNPTSQAVLDNKAGEASDGDEEMVMSDEEDGSKPQNEWATPLTPMDLTVEGLKRKRDDGDDLEGIRLTDAVSTPSKYMRPETPLPPPPPPVPQDEDPQSEVKGLAREDAPPSPPSPLAVDTISSYFTVE